MNTVTKIGTLGIRRGDYIEIGVDRHRVTRATDVTLTIRRRHAWRAVEWLRARYEDARWWIGDRTPRIVTRD